MHSDVYAAYVVLRRRGLLPNIWRCWLGSQTREWVSLGDVGIQVWEVSLHFVKPRSLPVFLPPECTRPLRRVLFHFSCTIIHHKDWIGESLIPSAAAPSIMALWYRVSLLGILFLSSKSQSSNPPYDVLDPNSNEQGRLYDYTSVLPICCTIKLTLTHLTHLYFQFINDVSYISHQEEGTMVVVVVVWK